MGHLADKDIYRKLGRKLDGMPTRAPWTPVLRSILQDLYSPQEAELVTQMPYTLASLERIVAITGLERTEAGRLLERLCRKGLVFDLWSEQTNRRRYAPSPIMIGVFEFTMMRTAPEADHRRRAQLFHEYFEGSDFFRANTADRLLFPLGRALPHEGAVAATHCAEILDFERASSIVTSAYKLSLGTCSCRHELLHATGQTCETPLRTCSSFGYAADYLIRHGLAREASRTEMLEQLDRSRELGLVLSADNVQRNVTFLCHCCSCCCNLLRGITRYGCSGTLITSNYLPAVDEQRCQGCGKCVAACPISSISLRSPSPDAPRRQHRPLVNEAACLGCGVCVTRCSTQAMHLVRRTQRVWYPSTTFERVILESLARGTLQNLIFDNPQSGTQEQLRAVVGAFLRLSPVKQALLSNTLRSTFLSWLTAAAKVRRQGAVTHL